MGPDLWSICRCHSTPLHPPTRFECSAVCKTEGDRRQASLGDHVNENLPMPSRTDWQVLNVNAVT